MRILTPSLSSVCFSSSFFSVYASPFSSFLVVASSVESSFMVSPVELSSLSLSWESSAVVLTYESLVESSFSMTSFSALTGLESSSYLAFSLLSCLFCLFLFFLFLGMFKILFLFAAKANFINHNLHSEIVKKINRKRII